MFDKDAKAIQQGSRNSCAGAVIYFHTQKMNLELYLIPHAKINSKWIIVQNIRANTINCWEKNIGVILCDPGKDLWHQKYNTQNEKFIN